MTTPNEPAVRGAEIDAAMAEHKRLCALVGRDPTAPKIYSLWFDKNGCGPSYACIEIYPVTPMPGHDYKPEDHALGLQFAANKVDNVPWNMGDCPFGAGPMLDRSDVVLLHQRLGAWLEATGPVAPVESPASILPEGMRVVVVRAGEHEGRVGTVLWPRPRLAVPPGFSIVQLDAEDGQPPQPDGTPGRGGRGGITLMFAHSDLRAEVTR